MFLEQSIPNNQMQLSFNFTVISLTEGSIYYSSLLKAATKITELLEINNLHLSNKEFCGIVSSASKWSSVKFFSWFIESDSVCNFNPISESKIKELNFENSGDVLYSDWDQYPRRFKNIIHGIANNSHLRTSLLKIQINSCGISKAEAVKTLEWDKLEYIIVEWKNDKQ